MSLSYNLQREDGAVVPVCKEMFCSTLGVAKKTVGNWLSTEGRNKEAAHKAKRPKSGEYATLICL